jgi:hypothetical protein
MLHTSISYYTQSFDNKFTLSNKEQSYLVQFSTFPEKIYLFSFIMNIFSENLNNHPFNFLNGFIPDDFYVYQPTDLLIYEQKLSISRSKEECFKIQEISIQSSLCFCLYAHLYFKKEYCVFEIELITKTETEIQFSFILESSPRQFQPSIFYYCFHSQKQRFPIPFNFSLFEFNFGKVIVRFLFPKIKIKQKVSTISPNSGQSLLSNRQHY